MMLNIIGGANLGTLWKGFLYIFGLDGSSSATSPKKPYLVISSFVVLTVLMASAYACVLFETILGATATSFMYPQTTNWTLAPPMLGRVLNETLCTGTGEPGFTALCGMMDPGSGSDPMAPEGIRTVTNTSTANQVAFSDDQTAIIVSPLSQIPLNFEYAAQGYGVQSSCQSVTTQCFNMSNPGPDAFPILNCSADTLYNVSLNQDGSNTEQGAYTSVHFAIGVLDEDGNVLSNLKPPQVNGRYVALKLDIHSSMTDLIYSVANFALGPSRTPLHTLTTLGSDVRSTQPDPIPCIVFVLTILRILQT